MRSLAVFLLIFVVIAAGIAAVGYLYFQNYERQFRGQMENQLASIARLKVNELQDWRNERMADAEVFYRNPAFSALVQRYLENPADAQAQAELQAWLDRYQVYGQYDRVFLLDADGVERISSPFTAEPVAAHLIQEAAAVLSAGQVTFLDFHRYTTDGSIHLALLVPISGEQDNRPPGVLVLHIDPNVYLYPYLQQWPVLSASAETLLVRREGTAALLLNELRFQTGTALNLRFQLESTQLPSVKAVLGQTDIVTGVDYRGVPVIAAIYAVPGSPWFLVAKVDTTEVYAPLRDRLWQTLVFFGALMATVAAGLGLIWRHQRVRYYRGQVEAAQALAESEERYQLANRATFNAVWDWNLQTDALWWNENFQTLFGYQPDEIEPGIESWTGRIHPEDLARVETGIHAAIDSGQQSWFDHYRFRRKDGQYAEIEDRGYIVKDASGKPVRMIGAMQDITGRKQAEAALAQERILLRTVIDNLPDAIYVKDAAARKILANRADLENIGKPEAEVLGKSDWDVFPEDVAARFYADDQTVLQRGQAVINREELLVNVSGQSRWLLTSKLPLRDSEGRITGIVGIGRDITGRKQAEETVRWAEERYRKLFDEAPIMYVLTRPEEGRPVIADCNQTFLDTLGYTRSEVLAQPLADFYTPASAAELLGGGYQRALEGQFQTEERQLVARDGRVIETVLQARPELDAQGRVVGTRAAFVDITGRKQAEEETRQLLKQSERSRRALLSLLEDQKQAEEAVRRYADRLAMLHEIDQATLALQPVEEIAALALRGIRELVPCYRADVALPDPATGEFTVLAVHAEGETRLGPGTRFFVAVPVLAQRQNGKAQVIEDLDALPDLPPVLQTLRPERVRSFVGVPMLAQGELTGLLHLAADRPAAFTAEHITIAREVADQLAIAIQQARLREQVQRYTAELEQRVAERTAELQTANEKLKELDRFKSQFVSNVSHELRTPLTNVKTYLWLLDHGKPDKREHYMATLHRETDLLQHQIESLLQLSRLDLGKVQLTLAPMDVNRMAGLLISDRAILFSDRGLTLYFEPQLDLPPVLGDEKMLIQVLTNLMTNAMNYTPRGGTVTVSTAVQIADSEWPIADSRPVLSAAEGLPIADDHRLSATSHRLSATSHRPSAISHQPSQWVTFSVSDTGPGISPEEQARLFERFFRGEAGRKSNAPGTGLGLAICQEIVQRHNGRITIESAVGQGSTFTVWLPAE
jgi:PAS domain S-box-containing protein